MFLDYRFIMDTAAGGRVVYDPEPARERRPPILCNDITSLMVASTNLRETLAT